MNTYIVKEIKSDQFKTYHSDKILKEFRNNEDAEWFARYMRIIEGTPCTVFIVKEVKQ